MNTEVTGDANSGKITLISKTDLAIELNKSHRTIEMWVKAGYISCIKVGRSVFFDRNQVMADLRRFQTGPRFHH